MLHDIEARWVAASIMVMWKELVLYVYMLRLTTRILLSHTVSDLPAEQCTHTVRPRVTSADNWLCHHLPITCVVLHDAKITLKHS